MDQDSAPEQARHREWSTPGDRATRGEGRPHRETHTDLSNALAAVRSLPANRNRAPRSARSVGTQRVARHPPGELLAVQCRTGEPRPAGAELLRYCTAETPLAPER